jgi:hypothetical protein
MRLHPILRLLPALLLFSCFAFQHALAAGVASPAGQSIKRWATCDGRADDTAATAKAFMAARHNAFTLIVDCPVRLHFGSDVGRSLFIDDGTHVIFNGAGKFIVDNVFQPAFVVANSSDITLTDWDVEYQGGLPVDPDTGGFQRSGKFVAQHGRFQPAAAFNDTHITSWLTNNRGINFDQSLGHVTSVWVGPTNTSSVFFICGDVARVRVSGMRLHVPAGVGAEHFIPMAFSFSRNYRSRQTVTSTTPLTAQFLAVPHDLSFSNIDVDGAYMGWQGNLQDATFEHIRSHRYADLQDERGGAVGGIGKWFAPPHLFYLNYAKDADPALFNKNITIRDVVDSGPRIGKARDSADGDTLSGNALSLKVGGVNILVDGYRSSRPDGFLDVLASDGLTISNVQASYDSSFLHDLYPGLRFPDSPYTNIIIRDVVLTDVAPETAQRPIGNAMQASNDHIVFSNVEIRLNRWAGAGSPQPVIAGSNNQVSINVVIGSAGAPHP